MTRMSNRQSTRQMVKEHLKASKAAQKKILKSKATARAFLVRIGLIDKNGKRLTQT